MKILLFIPFLIFSISAKEYPTIDEEVKIIKNILEGLEKDFNGVSQGVRIASAQKAKPEKKIASTGFFGTNAMKVEVEEASIEGDIYHYAYMPPKKEKCFDEEGVYRGCGGDFVLSFVGELAEYGAGSKGRFGFAIDFGWQLDFHYVAFVIASSVGIRKSPLSGMNLIPVGLKGILRLRAMSWLFPYGQGGVEFVNIQPGGGWEYPFKVFGGGLMFRLSGLDSKSEFDLYRSWGVTRMMLLVSYNVIRSNSTNPATPNTNMLRAGISIEF